MDCFLWSFLLDFFNFIMDDLYICLAVSLNLRGDFMAGVKFTLDNDGSIGSHLPKNGTAEVRNGKIIVTDPDAGGNMAKISDRSGVELFIDEVKVMGSTAVSENSNIRAVIHNREPERKADIHVADDKMSASIKVYYNDGEKYRLKDQAPSNEIVIDVVSDGTIQCPRFTLDEVIEVLKSKGIVYGIEKEKLNSVILESSKSHDIIAKGLKPVDGGDDRVEAKFDGEKKYDEINGRIDFYSIGRVVSVEPDTVVAEKIPGSEGVAGIDVFGNEVPPKPGKKIDMLAGQGIRLSEDGLKAYSKIKGRPDIKWNTVSVYEVYKVSSDVDISTGNIDFTGDIVINGNITDGMKVKCGNNLLLYGSITGSRIYAGYDVSIKKNAIGSSIRAGRFDFTKCSMIDCLEPIKQNLESIFYATDMLKDTGKVPKTYKDGQIIKILLDTKFKNITENIDKLRSLLFNNKDQFNMGILELGARLVKYFTGNGPLLIEDYLELKDLADEVEKHMDILKNSLTHPSDIEVSYVQSSILSTSGDIIIKGRGCYNSRLSCKGSVIFQKPGSVMRGGVINAFKDIRINELGSPGGAYTVVETGKDAVVTCEIAYANSVIKIGNLSTKLTSSFKKLKAYQDRG
ncbi:MAG TPA: hypothetical protein DD429_10535, partial [Clostridiaceae bacterium]|nr:hypothetical protein [Clostridiaceae bacterium]